MRSEVRILPEALERARRASYLASLHVREQNNRTNAVPSTDEEADGGKAHSETADQGQRIAPFFEAAKRGTKGASPCSAFRLTDDAVIYIDPDPEKDQIKICARLEVAAYTRGVVAMIGGGCLSGPRLYRARMGQ